MNIDIQKIKENPEKTADKLSIQDLEKLITLATEKYYSDNNPLISDYVYDVLVDTLEKKNKTSKVLSNIGFKSSEDKIKLPYYMGSMDKIKTKDAVLTWINKFKSSEKYVISDKLDGISALYINKDGENARLFTRGNGEYGKCITNLIKYLNLPKKTNVVLRGELIISKTNFDKNRGNYISSRSMVNGFVSKKQKETNANILDFVVFEVIEPQLTPIEQFKFLEKHNFRCPNYSVHEYKDIIQWNSDKNNFLTNTLNLFKTKGKYDIDGIIITQNKIYKRIIGNPKHSIAFKLNNYGKITKIKDIEWSVSKYGILIPRIFFEKIDLGSNVEYCTGFSGKFIFNNSLGPGSIIRVVLSGEVIPYLVEIIKNTYPKMPDTHYKWSDNNLHCVSINESEDLNKKKISYFIKTIGIENLSVGLVNKLYDNGYTTIKQILDIRKEELLKLDGFKETLANKIISSINTVTSKPIYLGLIMVGSLEFNSGFGIKRFRKILDKYPNILIDNITVDDIINIDGFQTKTAAQFISNLNNFKIFLKNIQLKYYIKDDSKKEIKKNEMINNKYFVLTGFRDGNITKFIEDNGGTIQSDVNLKTSCLIIKDLTSKSQKLKKAEIVGCNIRLLSEFKNLFKI